MGQLAAAASNAAREINDRLLMLRGAAYNLGDYRSYHIINYFDRLCYRQSVYRPLILLLLYRVLCKPLIIMSIITGVPSIIVLKFNSHRVLMTLKKSHGKYTEKVTPHRCLLTLIYIVEIIYIERES